MSLKPLNCPNCGGKIENFDETLKKGICPYCDTIINDVPELQKAFKVEGKVEIVGNTSDDMSARAETFLEIGELGRANIEFQNMTREFPADYRGWWGLVRVQTNDFVDFMALNAQSNINYERALKFANEKDKEQIIKIYNEARQKQQTENDRIEVEKRRVLKENEEARRLADEREEEARRLAEEEEEKRKNEYFKQRRRGRTLLVLTTIVYLIIQYKFMLWAGKVADVDSAWLPKVFYIVGPSILFLTYCLVLKNVKKIGKGSRDYLDGKTGIIQILNYLSIFIFHLLAYPPKHFGEFLIAIITTLILYILPQTYISTKLY